MNKRQKILVTFLFAVMLAIFGCAAFQDVVVPAYIDEDAIDYSEEKSIMFTPWTSLWDLNRIKKAVDFKHQMKQAELLRDVDDDNMWYAHLSSVLFVGKAGAEEFKANVFNPQGPLGLLLAAGPALGIGLMFSKPGDKKKIVELETKLNGGK